jgi:hypothetical protein
MSTTLRAIAMRVKPCPACLPACLPAQRSLVHIMMGEIYIDRRWFSNPEGRVTE